MEIGWSFRIDLHCLQEFDLIYVGSNTQSGFLTIKEKKKVGGKSNNIRKSELLKRCDEGRLCDVMIGFGNLS